MRKYMQVLQLVLKADAIKTVGLKKITSKHLAVASQCLSCVLEILVSLRERFSSVAKTTNVRNED